MGRLLSGVAGRDTTAVDAQLKAARDEIMAPLSAAAMESYARAYPHQIRLHMLQEASDAATLLQVSDLITALKLPLVLPKRLL